jgi:iron(II)-dependent oxidoreductase
MKYVLSLALVLGVLAVPFLVGSAAAEDKTDGMVFVPGGGFRMGAKPGDKPTNDSPEHMASVKSFWIDRYEVTNGEYQKFIAAGGYGKKEHWSEPGFAWVTSIERTAPDGWEKRKEDLGEEFAKHPVTGVAWFEADAFACYEGKRLPTETEWERAARSVDGRKYPWGNDFKVGFRTPKPGDLTATNPIGSNPADISAEGIFDMGASVSEWTSSWFVGYPGTKYKSRYWGEDAKDRKKVARGGSWRSESRSEKTASVQCRTTHREIQYSWRRGHPFIGFRLAMDGGPARAPEEGEESADEPEESEGDAADEESSEPDDEE